MTMPKSVTLPELRGIMKAMVQIAPKNTAMVAIDMHRGHLDPPVATMSCAPEDCDRVIQNAKDVLDFARQHQIPVIHVILVLRKLPRGTEMMSNPFFQHLYYVSEKHKFSLENHNIEGRVQTEIIPELYQADDYVINNKKCLDSFYGTDLETLLRALRVDTTVIIGINTNTCVLNACFSAGNRGFKVIVISDCVASMYAPELHTFALENISGCLGWVLSVAEFKQKVLAAKD